MIEFKRAGDVMVFTCHGFKIEVAGNGAERIEFNRDAINSSSNFIEYITDAFKILDMMIEHKMRQTHVLKTDINCEGLNSEIERLKKRLFESNHINCVAGK